MFDLILALIILPVFVAAAVCYRSWLKFNESKTMFSERQEKPEEFEFILSHEGAETFLIKRPLESKFRRN